jgi:predicted dienelactone hydrolase
MERRDGLRQISVEGWADRRGLRSRRARPSSTATTGAPVDAVVSLAGDAALFGAPGLSAVTAPVLVVGGTADADSPFTWSSRLADDSVSSPRKAEVALVGVEHFVFTGGCGSVRRLLTPTAGEVLSPGRADVEDVRYRAVGY